MWYFSGMSQPSQVTVAIIPARGGSKKIPRKNILNLGGRPLIAWPISLAQSIPAIQRVIVSTDDDEIADTARMFGAEVPFLRPANLSGDEVPTLPVLQHALDYLKSNEGFHVDNVVLLYATNPFLRRDRIIEGIQLLESDQCRSVVGVRKVRGVLWQPGENEQEMKQFYPKERVNRQYFSHLYEEAGNIFLAKADLIQQENKIVSESLSRFVVVDDDEMVDIDAPEDLMKAAQQVKGELR